MEIVLTSDLQHIWWEYNNNNQFLTLEQEGFKVIQGDVMVNFWGWFWLHPPFYVGLA